MASPTGVHQFFSKLLAHVESKIDVERMWDAGNAVIVVGRTRGRVRPSGKLLDVSIAHVWRTRDQKIIGFEPHIDTPAMLEALAQ